MNVKNVTIYMKKSNALCIFEFILNLFIKLLLVNKLMIKTYIYC